MTKTESRRANNSSLAAVLSQIGVQCSGCLINALTVAPEPVRKQYYTALKMTPEQTEVVETHLKHGGS